jgi:hypothetical protein
MKEELKKQLDSVVSLLESCINENSQLAIEIMKGNRTLKKAVTEYYRPLFTALYGRVNFKLFLDLPEKLADVLESGKPIPHVEILERMLPRVPICQLFLNYLELKEIPWWVFHLKDLDLLDLSNNNITELPADITKLKHLRILILNHNKLKSLPENIGELTNLDQLQLDFNKIEKLPESIGNLHNLTWLCLENNKITSLPQSCSELQSLYWLSIEGTPLGKKIKDQKWLIYLCKF